MSIGFDLMMYRLITGGGQSEGEPSWGNVPELTYGRYLWPDEFVDYFLTAADDPGESILWNRSFEFQGTNYHNCSGTSRGNSAEGLSTLITTNVTQRGHASENNFLIYPDFDIETEVSGKIHPEYSVVKPRRTPLERIQRVAPSVFGRSDTVYDFSNVEFKLKLRASSEMRQGNNGRDRFAKLNLWIKEGDLDYRIMYNMDRKVEYVYFFEGNEPRIFYPNDRSAALEDALGFNFRRVLNLAGSVRSTIKQNPELYSLMYDTGFKKRRSFSI